MATDGEPKEIRSLVSGKISIEGFGVEKADLVACAGREVTRYVRCCQ